MNKLIVASLATFAVQCRQDHDALTAPARDACIKCREAGKIAKRSWAEGVDGYFQECQIKARKALDYLRHKDINVAIALEKEFGYWLTLKDAKFDRDFDWESKTPAPKQTTKRSRRKVPVR